MSNSVNRDVNDAVSGAVNDAVTDSLPSRAPADQGTREGNEGREEGSNSPSIPPSPTSTPEPRVEVDGTDLRPVDEPFARLRELIDEIVVAPGWREQLRWVVAAAERERDEARDEVEALTASLREVDDNTPSGKRSADYWLRMTQGAETERDKALARAVAAVARLAAVERAIPAILAPIDMIRHSLDCTMRPVIYNGARCSCDLPSQIRRAVQSELHAALAAPSPQADPRWHGPTAGHPDNGPQAEPATCPHGKTKAHWQVRPGGVGQEVCPGPQSTKPATEDHR